MRVELIVEVVTLDVLVREPGDANRAKAWSVIDILREAYRPAKENLVQLGRAAPTGKV